MCRAKRKRVSEHLRTAKANIILCIHAVWSGPSSSANRITHYENTPIQIYWELYHQKMKTFRNSGSFYISAQHIDCRYLVEPPRYKCIKVGFKGVKTMWASFCDVYTTKCINGEQRPGWYFAHAQDDLKLCNLCMFEDIFRLPMCLLGVSRQGRSRISLCTSIFWSGTSLAAYRIIHVWYSDTDEQ